MLVGKSILITGGAGAFGQAFARACLALDARRVIIYSRGEAAQAAMESAFRDPRLRFFVGDVRDQQRITDACRNVQIVIHAAALKRIEVCERDPREAQATNVGGTQAVAHACIACGVERGVFLSTDKAAAPHTLYGVTKLAAERLWLQSNVYAAGTPTRFTATRYGNVLGSTGSVLPLWRAQAAAGQPLTITDPEATRFWMTMHDAVALVLVAIAAMRGGELFVPKIGAASLATLVDAILPDWKARGIGAEITGLRPGEKRHEMLITPAEVPSTYDAGDYYLIEPPPRTWAVMGAPEDMKRVPPNFRYESDTARQLTADELRRMIGS